jgi:hypothetical protein
MSRLFCLAGALALAVIVAGAGARAEQKDKIPEIGEIMQKAHGKDGLRGSVTKAIKEKEWDEAAKTVKAWEKLGQALAKNKPEKGSAASWKKQTTTYNKTLKTLATAIGKKNANAANGALGKIGSSCKVCHEQHRGEE